MGSQCLIGKIPPALFFFLKIVLAICGLLCFHTNRETFCSNSVKNALGKLIGIALNLQIALGSIGIFTVLILPIQDHGISLLHLFLSSLISFISILQFSEYRSFASLGRFIPRYFSLFDAIVNGIVSLISLSDLSLLVYRNARDFCVLVLYPATLPNSLMSSSSVLVASQDFLCIVSCHLQTVTVQEFQCGKMKILWRWLVVMVVHNVNVLNATELYT